MFTGIVEEVGRIRAVESFGGGLRFTIEARLVIADLRPGDSIAVDGVCQTAVRVLSDGFLVESIGTTLSRTTLGKRGAGDSVNLERALALGDRLGGHMVQGHVDGVAAVVALERRDEHVLLTVQLPDEVADVTVLHGSIALNGVSLTVNALPGPNRAQVALIPHTWDHTNLRHLAVGDRVNVEGDMVGRFIAHLLDRRGSGAAPPAAPTGREG